MDTESRPARQSKWASLQRQARALEPLLVGMTVAAARAKVAETEGLTMRIASNGAVTADYRPGRIDVYVRDGVIISPEVFFGRTELHHAVVDGDLARVQGLLDAGADPRAADRSGATALHFAAQQQLAEAVPMLIAAGAEVDARDGQGSTPLSLAVSLSKGGGETIQALLTAGADADIINDMGVSPRQLAAKLARCELTRFL